MRSKKGEASPSDWIGCIVGLRAGDDYSVKDTIPESYIESFRLMIVGSLVIEIP